jgi:23S rRNA (cytidine1920-2'-O)/16S rRNA (cytidine1409-2'-O)-methyltransferase
VHVLERTNVRHLQPADIGGPVPVTVADLSFISLVTVAPALTRCTTPDGALILLLKPQFEAGRSKVGRRGVVTDRAVHADVLVNVTTRLADQGIVSVAVAESPLRGADGNREFLLHCRRDGSLIDTAALVALVGTT